MTMTIESEVSTAAFGSDSKLLVGGGEQVHLWDGATGELIQTLPVYASGYTAAPAISPDGQFLAVPGYPLRVYDIPTASEVYTIPLGARTVAWSPDGSRLASAGFEAAGVWNAATGEMIFLAGHVHGADAVAWSPDGRLLVTGGPDGRFRIWDAGTGAELWTALAVELWWE
jgi:WD40 repeat protein